MAAQEEALAAEVASRAVIEAPNGPDTSPPLGAAPAPPTTSAVAHTPTGADNSSNSSPSLEAQPPTPTAAHSLPAFGATETAAVPAGTEATVASVLAEADLRQYGELRMHATPAPLPRRLVSYPPTSPLLRPKRGHPHQAGRHQPEVPSVFRRPKPTHPPPDAAPRRR